MKALLAGALVAMPAVQLSARDVTAAGTAMTFYLLANEGRCAQAEALFTPQSISVLKNVLGSDDAFAKFCRDKGGDSPLISLAIKSEVTAGSQVEVEIMRTYQRGIAFERDTLVRVGSDWKIVIGASVPALQGVR